MKYQAAVAALENGLQDYKTLRVVELGTTQERADISGIALDEEEGDWEDEEESLTSDEEEEDLIEWEGREERTGATHLVHCWYPLGHSVSEWKYMFAPPTNYPLEKDGTII
jgi:hypothetical protein